MAKDIWVLVKTLEFTNGAKHRFPIAFFSDKAAALDGQNREHGELSAALKMVIGTAHPDGNFDLQGNAQGLLAAMGIKGVHVGIVAAEMQDGGAILLPAPPRLIVPS